MSLGCEDKRVRVNQAMDPSIKRGHLLTTEDSHARDNDGLAKQKGKDYADNQPDAKESHLQNGD